MRRQAIVLLAVTGLLLGMVCSSASRAWAASDTATLKSVSLSATSGDTQLLLRVVGDYSYQTVQSSPEALMIDLTGAKAEGVAPRQHWSNPVLAGYQVTSFKDSTGQPGVRVQVDTRQVRAFVAVKDRTNLRLVFGKRQVVAPAADPSPVASLAPMSADSRSMHDAPAEDPLLVSNVTLDKHNSGETFVDVATSRSAVFHVTTLPNPSRLVVDFAGAQKKCSHTSYAADTGVLKEVRVGQLRLNDQAVVRVVADLKGDPAFDVHATPSGVRIEIRPRSMANAAPVEPAVPAPHVKLRETKAVQAAVVAPARRAVTVAAVNPEVQSTLPAAAESRQAEAAPIPPPPSVTPEALRARQAAQTLRMNKADYPEAAQGAAPAGAVVPEESKPVYTGEPISVNFKDVDIKDFFREIHEISGLNIIVDPNVSGTVTLVLDNVPWDQALDIVLKNNGLGRVMEGNVLRIARMSTLTAEQQEQTKLADARINAAPLVTVFRPINYAKASDIAALLQKWAGGGALSRRGTVLVDMRDNTLIISDIQAQIPIVMNIVAKIDKKAKQVSIEARVVLATADFTRTLSAALSGSTRNTGGSTQVGGATGTGASITPTNTVPNATSPLSGLVIPANVSSGFGAIAITNASSRYLINAVISAQEERDQAKTISRPTIVTQNNVQGMVMQGVQVPIQTNINNTIAVQYENATLQMQVTPQVTDDNNIFLILSVQNASVGAVVSNAGPNINTQQATTSVLVPDGGTVVFGGITVTSRSKAATYVPLLGSIPVVGHLFKTSNTQDQDQELLFFVSPKVLPG